MRVYVTYSWHPFNKVPTMFSINETVELGFSFRKVKILNNSKVMRKYYFTLSLLFFKIIVDFNSNKKWKK